MDFASGAGEQGQILLVIRISRLTLCSKSISLLLRHVQVVTNGSADLNHGVQIMNK